MITCLEWSCYDWLFYEIDRALEDLMRLFAQKMKGILTEGFLNLRMFPKDQSAECCLAGKNKEC